MARKHKRGRPRLKRIERKAYKEYRKFYARGHKTAIKLFIWKEEDMSKEGLSHFPIKARPYIRKKRFMPLDRIDVDVEDIDTKEKIGRFILDNYSGETGTFIIRGFSHGKTKTKIKQVRLAKVMVFHAGDEFRAHVSEYGRLSRYKWFWRG